MQRDDAMTDWTLLLEMGCSLSAVRDNAAVADIPNGCKPLEGIELENKKAMNRVSGS
jgi:hypothetical protein